MHLAALFGNTSVISDCCLDNECNKIDTRIDRTSLIWAVIGGHEEMVRNKMCNQSL